MEVSLISIVINFKVNTLWLIDFFFSRKGLTHAFGQKTQFFSLFVSGQNNTRNKL